MAVLPTDVTAKAFDFLPPCELAVVGGVNRDWRKAQLRSCARRFSALENSSSQVWQHFYHQTRQQPADEARGREFSQMVSRLQAWHKNNEHLFSAIGAAVWPLRRLTHEEMGREFDQKHVPLLRAKEEQLLHFFTHLGSAHPSLAALGQAVARSSFASKTELIHAWMASHLPAMASVQTLPEAALSNGVPSLIPAFPNLNEEALNSVLASISSMGNVEAFESLIRSPLFNKISQANLVRFAESAAENDAACLTALLKSRRGPEIPSSKLASLLQQACYKRQCFQAITAVGRLGEIDSPSLNKAFLQAAEEEDYLHAFLVSEEALSRIEASTLGKGLIQAAEKGRASCLSLLLQSRRAHEISADDLSKSVCQASAAVALPYIDLLIQRRLLPRLSPTAREEILHQAARNNRRDILATMHRTDCFKDFDPARISRAILIALGNGHSAFVGQLVGLCRWHALPFDETVLRIRLNLLTLLSFPEFRAEEEVLKAILYPGQKHRASAAAAERPKKFRKPGPQ